MGRYLTPDEAAAWLGVSRRTVYRLITTGELPSVAFRRRRFLPEDALARWCEAQLTAASVPPPAGQLTSSPAAPAGATPPAPASSPAAGARRGSGR